MRSSSSSESAPFIVAAADGQRFATRTRGPETGALPRYFGHRRRVVAANVRDATYTLDGILENQTALEIEEHTTDTHGYTEMIFAAYDLLDLRFAPRIRDLDRQRLYSTARPWPARPARSSATASDPS